MRYESARLSTAIATPFAKAAPARVTRVPLPTTSRPGRAHIPCRGSPAGAQLCAPRRRVRTVACHADGDPVIDERLGLVDDGGRQCLEAKPRYEFSQLDGERRLFHRSIGARPGRRLQPATACAAHHFVSAPRPAVLSPATACGAHCGWSIIRRMRPREETISVGGIDVHTWVGGRAIPCWCSTAPAATAAGRAGWPGGGALHGLGAHPPGLRALRRRGVDGGHRRPGALLPLVHRGGAPRAGPPARPLDRRLDRGGDGHDEPGRDRPARARVARSASSPRRARSSTSSSTRRRSCASMTVHDPTTVPEWEELFGRPPTPAELEIADAQPGDDGAARLEALHAQSAARALPAARDEPGADRVGPRGPHRAASSAASSTAALLPNATLSVLERLRPPAADRAARRLRAPRARLPGKGRSVKLYYFSEMPHHEFPDEEGDKYPSLRLAFPNRSSTPRSPRRNYQRYLDEYELRRPGGLRRPHDQRAPLHALVRERGRPT